jgi:predicted ABC-type transport system involved in lysophospholipase L1 biosynthesis ATPase subunit
VVVDGLDLAQARESERAALRGRRVGIVYQSANLVPFLTLGENVELAAALARRPIRPAQVDAVLTRFGLEHRRDHRPARLSGGEQQRGGLAAVVAAQPRLLLGDEITGELDQASAAQLLDVLATAGVDTPLTIILATHDPDVARRADRIVRLRDGHIDDPGAVA